MMQHYYDQMNQIYYQIKYWPQPYQYLVWYQQLQPEYQYYSIHPQQYNQLYDYALARNRQDIIDARHTPSRAQKRRIKKKKLEEQLQSQKKAIGKWVNLQRKDLINQLGRIQEREKRKKQKKVAKLNHLIEIHKEVAKLHRKRQSNKTYMHKRVIKVNQKKRLSYIKKMKFEFEKQQGNKTIKKDEQQWQNQPQQTKQQKLVDQTQTKQQNLQQKTQKQPQKDDKKYNKIQYTTTGKLTGHIHNNIILRQWVRNYPNQQLQDITLKFINKIAFKQAIGKVQKQQKAKKLIVSGIKQCKRTMKTIIDKKRSHILIVALNIQRNPLVRGVDDQVQQVIKLAEQIGIPIVNVSTRSKLGRAFTGKFGPRVTMVSVINYQGYREMFAEVVEVWRKACDDYDQL